MSPKKVAEQGKAAEADHAKRCRDVRKEIARKYKERGEELFPPIDRALDRRVIPSPSAIINAVIGVGGYPRGRVTEIYGPESTGKTTLAIEAAVRAQREDPAACVLFVDYEHALDIGYAIDLGLDPTPGRFEWVQPDYFEQGEEVIQRYVRDGLVDLVVIDSVAAMIPLSTYAGEVDAGASDGKSKRGQVGLHAALLSKLFNWLTKDISRGREPAVVAINQTRYKIGTTGGGYAFQDATGGQALKFYSTVRLELGRARGEGDEGKTGEPIDQIHDQVRVTVTAVKNKVAPPFRRGAFVIGFGYGLLNTESVADLAIMHLGVKNGAWFSYQGPTPDLELRVQGRPRFVATLEGNPALLSHLEKEALAKMQERHRGARKQGKHLQENENSEVRIIKPPGEQPGGAEEDSVTLE